MTEFTSNDQEPIRRHLDLELERTPHYTSAEFTTYYGIDRTAHLIGQGDYKRIALQFPDELLHDSVPVYHALQDRLGAERIAYVLADTSYGSCCVDEVAASHVDADVLVHYGHACLSRTSRLPVIYVFGCKHLDVRACIDRVCAYLDEHENQHTSSERSNPRVLELRHDVAYTHLASEIEERLSSALGERYRILYDPLPLFARPAVDDRPAVYENGMTTEACQKDEDEDEGRKIILWIGEESSTLTKLLLTSSGNTVLSYSPTTNSVSQQSHLSNKLLMRRYALLQQARDADVFGILVGTLGVASYRPLLTHLRTLLKKAYKKCYTVSVGKINPAKLANFLEVQCWVWVACSEGMVDSKEYFRPIITPYELELALQPVPVWDGKYVFDFEELIRRGRALENRRDRISNEDGASSPDGRSADVEKSSTGHDREGESQEGEGDERDRDEPTFSLITGTYRHAKRYGQVTKENPTSTTTEPGTELIRQESAVSTWMENSAALHFLQQRTYQGLDPRVGLDAPSVLEQGRSGIASAYSTDFVMGVASDRTADGTDVGEGVGAGKSPSPSPSPGDTRQR